MKLSWEMMRGYASIVNQVRTYPFLAYEVIMTLMQKNPRDLQNWFIITVGEEGQLVGRIPDNDRLLQFDGYVNRKASSKKVLHNVWRKG